MKLLSRKQKPEAQVAKTPDVPPESQKSAQELEVERIIVRAARIRALSDEASMWRSFATGCHDGRWLSEGIPSIYCHAVTQPPRLDCRLDADTAKLWGEFALRMAEDRESRLRDLLMCKG